MSFHDFPDPTVPPSDLRCEAMTQPQATWQGWRAVPHRCIRRAVAGRAGYSVCSIHLRMKEPKYWDRKTPDAFPTPRNKERTS